MRSKAMTWLIVGLAPVASAHTLDGDATLAEELGHQLSSGHHLPLILLAVAVAAVFARRLLDKHR